MSFQPRLQHVAECVCETAEMCTDAHPGHALHPLQLRIAAATPSKWRNAFVSAIEDGWVTLVPFDDGDDVAVWHHADLTGSLTVGDPVALHSLYNVLAVGRARINVLPAV